LVNAAIMSRRPDGALLVPDVGCGSHGVPAASARCADRLATLLHEVADGAPEVDVDALAEEDWVEDHLAISDVEPGRIWFEGDVGPIVVPRKASDLAQPGWSAFVTAAKTDGTWRLLEVGFVYP
jgi:hypothetical protein